MQDPNYNHFIITRFNLKQQDWVKDKSNNALCIDKEWLKLRFDLFEKYCLPSVKAQTCRNFKWLIYFDLDTPDEYIKIIESYRQSAPMILPRFIEGIKQLLESIKNDISTETHHDDIVITSRLDNDDSLHEQFVEKIQMTIKKKKIINGVIDVPNGYCLQIKPDFALYSSIQYSNAFITYIEPFISNDQLSTVMSRPHPQWAYNVRTYLIKYEKLWLQIIHEKNVVNKAQGRMVGDQGDLLPFNIGVDMMGIKKAEVDRLSMKLKWLLYRVKKLSKKIWIQRRLFYNIFYISE